MAATLFLPATLFIWAGWSIDRKITALTDERIVRSLDVEQEHAVKSFQIATLIIDDATEDLLLAPLQGRELYFHKLFKTRICTVSEIQSIWLFDTAGFATVNSSAFPAPRDRNFAKEDYFHVHVDKDIGMYFGRVHKSFSGNPPYFTMSRRITRNGAFAGVLEISMMPGDFDRFYSHLVYSEGLQYALLRADGTFLVLYPEKSQLPPPPLGPESGFRKTIAKNPEGGSYVTTSPVDHIERRIGVRRLRGTPIYVSAGIATAAMRDEWLSEMFPYIAYGVPATLFLFITLLFVHHGLRRLNVEMDRREAAEGALRQAQRLDAIGHLTGGIAHDFNNLLTVIIGNLEAAQRQTAAISDAAKDRLGVTIGRAMQGAQRAATLTRRLLAFSRQQPLNPKSLDLNKLLLGLPDLLRGGLTESLAIEVVGAAGLWPVEADATELETAILNLAVNARDAMPDGGKLTIEANNTYLDEDYCQKYPDVRPGQYVQISVSDTGSGMSAEVRNRAFEPFFTTKDAGQGTGLGLSQVYGFVKQSGGHVNIYSELGEGTSVKIYLPRRSSNVFDDEVLAPQSIVNSSNECVLLVEDDEDVRDYLTQTLRESGFKVIAAANGEEALAAMDAHEDKIDLLLTDVMMPGMNGRKVAEAGTVKRPGMKVLFMTGYSRNAIVHHGRLDAGVELIQKPVTGDHVAAKIRSILDRK
jgi:signal transduction histidine kinase/ActR/RegA family two-component response regulator